MANSIAAGIHINQQAEWQWKTVDAGPRCRYLADVVRNSLFAAMKCFARLIAFCAASILSAQAQSASRVSQLSEQPKNVWTPDFTISNPDARGGVIAYSSNGLLLATAFDHAIQIYNVHRGAPFNASPTRSLDDPSTIHAIAFRDSNILASLAVDGSVKTWDVTSGRILHQSSLDSRMFAVSVFATGSQPLLATATRNQVTLWNYQSGKSLNIFETTDSAVSALAFTPDAKLLVIGTRKGVVRVFDVPTRKIRQTIDLDSPISALSASMNYIALGYSDGTLAELGFGGQTSTHEVSGHNDAVTVVAFSPQGERFASGSTDGTIKVWNAKSLTLFTSLKGNGSAIFAITFSADDRTLICSTTKGAIEAWRLPANP